MLNVPDFNCNLLSVSKVTRDLGFSLAFLPDLCYIQYLYLKNLVGIGKERDRLYYLELTEREKAAMVVLRKYDVWYKKLGHTSEVVLRKIQQIGDVGTCSQFCDSCI